MQLVFIAVIKLNAAGGKHGNFAVLNIHNIFCVRYYCRNVRGNVIGIIRQPQYKRAEFAHGYKCIGVIGAYNAQCIRALKPFNGFGNRLEKVACIAVGEHLRYNLRIRLAFKFYTLRL